MNNKTRTLSTKELFGRVVLLLFLGVLLAVTLVTAYDMSFSWNSTNIRVGGDEVSVNALVLDAEAEYFAYVYDIKAATVRYTGEGRIVDGVNVDPRVDDLDMQFYDTIFKVRNRYTPAIIRIRLTNISPANSSGGTVRVTLDRNTAIPEYIEDDDDIIMNEYMTSLMRFTLAQDPSWYSANADTLYDNLDSYLYPRVVTYAENNNGAMHSDIPAASTGVFTTVTKSGNTITDINKADFLVLDVAYSSSDIVDGHLDVYLYITYDATLIKEFQHSAGIDTDATTVGKTTEMANDLSNLIVGFNNI